MKRIKFVCSWCGSDDVRCDAWAQWDIASQDWVLAGTYDSNSWCDACEGETRLETVELSDAPLPSIVEGGWGGDFTA